MPEAVMPQALSHFLVGSAGLSAADWLALFVHFLTLSLLAVGGAITTVPDMQRFVVREHGWISDAQFTASIALAQAAPGPNVLFVAVIGFNVGGMGGVLATMIGTLLPSTTLALMATRWGDRNRDSRGMKSFTTGMAPITIGLLMSSGWILLEPTRHHALNVAVLVGLTLLLMLRTKVSPLWPICAGAVAGMLGWV